MTVSHERKRRDSETVATELPGSTIHESRKKRNEETTVVTEAPTTAARRKRNDIESTRITETAEESYRKKRHEESTTFASVVEENAEAVAHGDEVNEAARKKRHSEEATKSPEHSEVEEVEKREEGEVVTEEAENDSLKHDNGNLFTFKIIIYLFQFLELKEYPTPEAVIRIVLLLSSISRATPTPTSMVTTVKKITNMNSKFTTIMNIKFYF